MKNTPYVKKYDKNGNVTNPIKGGYFHDEQNRKQRRAKSPTHKFIGMGKNLPLTVVGHYKYLRSVQKERTKTGELNIIYHYLPC